MQLIVKSIVSMAVVDIHTEGTEQLCWISEWNKDAEGQNQGWTIRW
jgi:hypothetical protein